MLLKQSTARSRVVLLVDSTDHITGKTGLTLTIKASKDGGAFATITPTVTELESGFYALALTTSHTDTLGDLALHITSSGADPSDLVDQVVVELPGADSANVAAIKAKTDNLPSDPADASDIAAAFALIPTANDNADALLDRSNGIETSYTLRETLRLVLASLAGKISGANSTTVVIRDVDDTKDRITATTDADGNRTAIVTDVS